MKNEKKKPVRGLRGVCAAGLLAAALGGCGGGSGGSDPGIVFATPAKYRETVSLAGGSVPISVYLAKHRNTDKLKGWEGKKQDLSGCCQ